MQEISKQTIQSFASKVGIGEILARLLLERGVDTEQKARVFLHPKKDDFEDPLKKNSRLIAPEHENVARQPFALRSFIARRFMSL